MLRPCVRGNVFWFARHASRRDIAKAEVNHFADRFAPFDGGDLGLDLVRDGLEVFEHAAEPALHDGAGFEQVDDALFVLFVVHGFDLSRRDGEGRRRSSKVESD
jgi:hypothetical protein